MNFPLTFLWHQLLWLLLILPLLVTVYVWLMHRKKKLALRYASLAMVREAMGSGPSIRRHIAPLLFLLAVAAMLLAAARPLAVVTLPSQQQTIVLAIDVSGSMRATDVSPSRLAAAQNAAKAFLAQLPRGVKVGLVAFAGSAQIAQIPTTNREDLASAIDRFQLQRGTAIGNGIVLALAALFPSADIDLSTLQYDYDRSQGVAIDQAEPRDARPFAPVEPGSFSSASIVLLTDGQSTTGVDSIEAAKMAAERGVRVYTVGVGTVGGETIEFEGWSMHVRLDEETLEAIASKTEANYFHAGTADDLKKVYENLSSRLSVEKKETEISSLFALAAALLAVAAAGLSMLWFNRIL